MNPKKLARQLLPTSLTTAAETGYRRGRGLVLRARYGFPARGLKVIAVTGTNGKTTTCCLINEVLKAGGLKTALLTTAVIEINGQSRPNLSHRTVPLTAELLKFMAAAKAAKVDYFILEATSQALDQYKFDGIPVTIAAMTNLTQDHLDYHGTMERYATAKAKLFSAAQPKISLLNRDDDWFGYFRDRVNGEFSSYGQSPKSDARINGVHLSSEGSDWDLALNSGSLRLRSNLTGLFNVYNASLAALIGHKIGLAPKQIITGITAVKYVPGRMESIDEGQPFTVLVDYAHTPDALERVLQAARQVTTGRVLVVFGATGDRDKGKRPIMGQIACSNADQVFLTDDETYTETGDKIRQDVKAGMANLAKVTEIADRRQAIAAAFKAAKPGDIVILAGIGHQVTRTMGKTEEPWDEREVARELLRTAA